VNTNDTELVVIETKIQQLDYFQPVQGHHDTGSIDSKK
jgi:hypothetical protein